MSPRIREQTSVTALTAEERQQLTLDSIRELEEMHERGDIETHAYFLKKRALIKML